MKARDENLPLETGRFVVVYSDPITRRKPEGFAQLVDLVAIEGNGFERWNVRFVREEESPVLRLVHESDALILRYPAGTFTSGRDPHAN